MDPAVVKALREAKNLYDEGVLTVHEFAHQKRIILEGRTNSNGIEDVNEGPSRKRDCFMYPHKQAREERVAIGIGRHYLDTQQIVNEFCEFHREMMLWRFSCFFIARMNGFAIFGSSERDGSALKEERNETRISSSNNDTVIGVVVDCIDIGKLLQQYNSVRPFDKLYFSYLNTYPWDMQTMQYQHNGVSSDVCMMKGCFEDLHTHSMVPDFDIIVKMLFGPFVLHHERGARAPCGLLNASCPAQEYLPASSSNEVRSNVSRRLHVNTQRIAVAESKQLKHKRQADLRKESRRNLKALVARLDAALPLEVRNQFLVNKGAGARSLGENGRSLFDVLTDTIEYLRTVTNRQRQTVPGPLAIDDDTLQEGMRSSHSFVVMEVEMPTWTIQRANAGAARVIGTAPWGADSGGQCLINSLVHRDDVLPLKEMWQQALKSAQKSNANFRAKPQRSSRQLLRMCSYTHVRPLAFYSPPTGGELGGGCVSRVASSESVSPLFPRRPAKSQNSKACQLSDAFAAAEVGLCAPFTEKDPLLEEFEELPLPRPPYSPVAPAADALQDKDGQSSRRVPLMHYESMHIEVFAFAAGAAAAIGGGGGEHWRRGGVTLWGGGGGASSHSGAPHMLLVGSRHTADLDDLSHGATVGHYSTTSVAGRLHRNEATLSRDDIYVNGSFKFDSINSQNAAVTPGMFRESIEAHMKTSPTLDGEEMSVFRKMWCQLSLSAKWCIRTFVNFVYKWIQLHVFFDIDDEGIPLCCIHSRIDIFGLYQTPWKLMRYASLDALKDPIAYQNVKGFHSSKLPTVVGDENPIKIHLSLHLPKQSTNIEGNGKTISLMELWLSPILIPKFPSSSPSVPKETIDRTPRAREEKQLSSQFSLRVVEFQISGCRSEILQSAFLHGMGPVTYKWVRIPDGDACHPDLPDHTNYHYGNP